MNQAHDWPKQSDKIPDTILSHWILDSVPPKISPGISLSIIFPYIFFLFGPQMTLTLLMNLDGKISGLERRNYGDIIEGINQSDCPLTCKSTEITTLFVNDKIVGRNQSKIDVFFCVHRFPKL